MARAEPVRHGVLAWALALPLVALAGTDERAAAAALPEMGLLEFLAEEPGAGDELGEALLSGDLDREIERASKRRKVKDDEAKDKQ